MVKHMIVDRWGSYFRPAGMQKPEGTAPAPAMAAAASATATPVEVSAPGTNSGSRNGSCSGCYT